jgi:hypothetical protein
MNEIGNLQLRKELLWIQNSINKAKLRFLYCWPRENDDEGERKEKFEEIFLSFPHQLGLGGEREIIDSHDE